MATHTAPCLEVDRCERIDGQLIPRPMSGNTRSDIQEIVRSQLAEQAQKQGLKARQEWSITQPDDTQHSRCARTL